MRSSRYIVLLLNVILLFGCAQSVYDSPTVQQLDKETYFDRLRSEQNPYIIDVRTGLEYRKGHLEGAQNISLLSSEFDWRIADLDTSRTVFIYCETAHRSPFAAQKLKKLGFKRIYDLKGGYSTLRE